MPQTITTGYMALCEAAEREIEKRQAPFIVREGCWSFGSIPKARTTNRYLPKTRSLFFLRRWLAFGSCRADCAAHGPHASRAYPGRIKCLEKGGRAHRNSPGEIEVTTIRDTFRSH